MRKTLIILLSVVSLCGVAQVATPTSNPIFALQQPQATIPALPPVFLPLIAQAAAPAGPVAGNEWPMLAANPQRTSWTSEEVRGNLSLEWYRPIEPYIPYKIQPIAANGKVYVATARGLYALDAANGALLWVYPTEIPLGHSPTIATVAGKSIAYVGSYDRTIHAIDANTGAAMAGYTPFEAGGGFETNPLVVNTTIYAGNRDGYFYALGASTGELIWRYKTDGSILFSAAYKNGVVYFASNDAHAYALDANEGTLLWKSAKLPGAGFHSYWPVIFTDRASGNDYVVFTSGENYRFQSVNLVTTESDAIYEGIPEDELIGRTATNIPADWAPGTVAIDASILTNYFEENPHRRTVFVLESATGEEFTFDADGDGKAEYAPFNWSGVTHSGNKYPPVVNGIDGVYYQATGYIAPGWISRGGPVGWKFGSHYISRVDGNSIGSASDEPLAYSSGGKLLYYTLCCDRLAGAMDVSIPYGQPDRAWTYYSYNLANNQLAPGYQQMYDSGDSQDYNNQNGWQTYSGKNQSKNGVYGKHGSTQSPPIPYQGRVYMLKGNALLAFSTQAVASKTPLPLAKIETAPVTATPRTKSDLTLQLETEIQKMISAGPLRPGYHDSGFYDLYGNGGFPDERTFGELFDYFQNPADTVYTLLLAYPFLSATSQQNVHAYLENNYGPGAKYDFTKIVHVGWGDGAARELLEIPPEIVQEWGQPGQSPLAPATEPTCGGCGYWQHFPPFSFYAAWQYAQIIGAGDAVFAADLFDSMRNKLETPPSDEVLAAKPYWLNQYIAGYKGYLELEHLAGRAQDQNVSSTYQHLLELRVNNFSKDTPYPPLGSGSENWEMSYQNSLAVARNFMFLTPELADYLNQHIFDAVQEAVDEYEYVAPYWFVSKFDDSYGEGTLQHLYDAPALLQAKAYILKQPYAELVKWLDVPAFSQGDLFYIQNLVAALRAPEASTRRVNVPNLTAAPYAPALSWLGKVTPTTNYADLRALYYDEQLEVILHIFDRRLWHAETPNSNDLTQWDAASLLLQLDGNRGDAPTASSYRFVKQLWDLPTSKAAYQGNGADWIAAQTVFTATTAWRGNNPNDNLDDKGWSVTFIVPFKSLGLSGPPAAGAIWGLGVAIHDRDEAAFDSLPDQRWPEALAPSQPASWGQLRFGVPTYNPPPATTTNVITIRQGLAGVVVKDAHVGGHTICGDGLDHWSEWGDANYAGFAQVNIQNQWDISDFPCFSKYYVTFPLNSIPTNQQIVSATVTLNLFGNAGYEPGQAQPSAIQALVVADDWDEETISWNNAPLPIENVSVTWVKPVDFFDPGVPYDWDVSRAVADAYSTGQPLRLVFYSTDGDYHSGKYFWSSDASESVRPTLKVGVANQTDVRRK